MLTAAEVSRRLNLPVSFISQEIARGYLVPDGTTPRFSLFRARRMSYLARTLTRCMGQVR